MILRADKSKTFKIVIGQSLECITGKAEDSTAFKIDHTLTVSHDQFWLLFQHNSEPIFTDNDVYYTVTSHQLEKIREEADKYSEFDILDYIDGINQI